MPGTFLTVEDETRFLERLKANPPAAVVWPSKSFDGMKERSLSQTAPRITKWVWSTYRPLTAQRWIVMVPRTDGGVRR